MPLVETVGILLQILTPAAAIGAVALWRTHRVDRRNLVLKLYEQLIAPDMQTGRRLLHQYATSDADWWDVSSDAAAEARDKINGALAMFDVVGWYVEKKYVDADAILEVWSPALVRCWYRAYDPYIRVRRETEGWEGWSYYERLVRKAERHLERTGRTRVLEDVKWRPDAA